MNREREEARTDELLSAYVDGELDQATKARLEAQLEDSPDLRRQLEALRHTVSLVHSLPRVEAPRNFLVTPAMVEDAPAREVAERRAGSIFDRWFAPALSFATAVSAVLLVITLASGFLGGQFTTDRLAAPIAATEAVEIAEVPESEPSPEAAGGEEPEALLTAPTAEPMETPLASQVGSEATPADVAAEGAPPPAEATPSDAEGTPTTEAVGGGGVRPTLTPEAQTTEGEENGEDGEYYDDAPTTEEPISEEAPPATERAVPESGTAEEETPSPPPPPDSAETTSASVRWITPIAMALITLILAGATVLAWRAQRAG